MIKARILKNKIICVLLTIAMVLSFVGCSKDEESTESGETYIYYINKAVTKVVPKEYEIVKYNNKEALDDIIEQLQMNCEDVEVTRAIPSEVKVLSYSAENGILNIDFSREYYDMSKAQEVLTRAAVVLTTTQLPYIKQVSFNVDGAPLVIADKVVRNMQSSDFADNLSINKEANNTDTFVIYFANQDGSKLASYKFKAEYGSNVSKEEFIVNKLIEGPGEEEGYTRTIPNEVQLVNVYTVDHICYVTLSENFLTAQTTVSDELVIYSIVNSLSEVESIHKVDIEVERNSDAMYHNKIQLSQPMARNLDYVEKQETE